mmetsp:Transcript_23481/g.71863  ORF Transcript_23481/g.71863 Transcript_23481/m.71863 type:complete len:227 (+) Transcript_23481:419-1099(+)
MLRRRRRKRAGGGRRFRPLHAWELPCAAMRSEHKSLVNWAVIASWSSGRSTAVICATHIRADNDHTPLSLGYPTHQPRPARARAHSFVIEPRRRPPAVATVSHPTLKTHEPLDKSLKRGSLVLCHRPGAYCLCPALNSVRRRDARLASLIRSACSNAGRAHLPAVALAARLIRASVQLGPSRQRGMCGRGCCPIRAGPRRASGKKRYARLPQWPGRDSVPRRWSRW